MRVGVSLRSGYATDDARQGARWLVERARAAREAGLDSLFLGDQHVTAYPYYQNSPMLGRLLAEWGDRPAGALYLLRLGLADGAKQVRGNGFETTGPGYRPADGNAGVRAERHSQRLQQSGPIGHDAVPAALMQHRWPHRGA